MKHTLKQMVSILLTAAMLITLLPWLSQRSSAQDTSGSWGDHLTYHFYEETGLLEFSGSGDMYNSASPDASPWYVFRERITAITFPEGMTGIGANTFNDCTALTGITVPESVTYIEGYAFSGCTSLYDMTVQNAACDIYSTSNTLGVPGTTVIHGYVGSTAQEYAYRYGYAFVSLSGDTPPAPEPIPIDGEHFPDENFREYVRGFDSDKDGYLNYAERTGVTDISCTEYGIASLEGIGYFPALTWLYCGGNQLTSLDVSQNTALEGISCEYNQLTTLDLSKNTALECLYCDGNQLTALDVSNNTALYSLSCGDNQLMTLDVSKNMALTGLNCEYNQLTALNVGKNTALRSLYCWENQLTALDVSGCTALSWLYCSDNQLAELDVSKNAAALWDLSCNNNLLTELDVSKNTALEGLYCNSNQLTTLDLSKNIDLKWIDCSSNMLTALDVSGNTKLTQLCCEKNQIAELDISENPTLEYVLKNGTKETWTTDYCSKFIEGDGWYYKLSFDFLTAVHMSDGSVYRTPVSEIFSDVKDSAYYADAVLWAVRNGITSGTGEGQFSPKATCTREQIVTFLYCAAGKPAYTITENPFTDVHEGKWYYDAVMWAYENGITTGVGTSTFGKGQGCTRAQAMTFLWKSLGCPEPETEENPFEDVAPGKYYYKAVLWALENGVTSGTSPTTFGSGDTCTRAQIVTFLYKVYGNG